jgi:hypothetical protein
MTWHPPSSADLVLYVQEEINQALAGHVHRADPEPSGSGNDRAGHREARNRDQPGLDHRFGTPA